MSADDSKAVGIKDIALALGVSIGTVDRALHGRTGVNEKTRARILKMAAELDYRPNVAARNLKLNRHIRVAAYLPRKIEYFFDPLRDGIRAAAAAVHGVNVDLTFRDYARMGEGDVKIIEEDLAASGKRYDAVILSPGNPARMEPLLQRFNAVGTAVVCVATDAPNAERLTSIAVDAAVSGGLAAELLGRAIQKKASVAVVTGDLGTEDHAEKLRGFAATVALLAPHLSLLPALETHERAEEAYQAAVQLLRRKPRPEGLYISTANSLPVLRALEERKLLGEVQVITTDLFPELLPLIERGKILASLHQRPFTQGKAAFEALVQFLIRKERPRQMTRLAPHIIMRSNLSIFTRLRDREEDT
jgi:LacI family transcriptional regulator